METDFEITRDLTSTDLDNNNNNDNTSNTNEAGDNLKDIFDTNVGEYLHPCFYFIIFFLCVLDLYISEPVDSIEAEMEELLKNSGVVYSHNNAVRTLTFLKGKDVI
jgi:hypothetical protein